MSPEDAMSYMDLANGINSVDIGDFEVRALSRNCYGSANCSNWLPWKLGNPVGGGLTSKLSSFWFGEVSSYLNKQWLNITEPVGKLNLSYRNNRFYFTARSGWWTYTTSPSYSDTPSTATVGGHTYYSAPLEASRLSSQLYWKYSSVTCGKFNCVGYESPETFEPLMIKQNVPVDLVGGIHQHCAAFHQTTSYSEKDINGNSYRREVQIDFWSEF
jgi:hypothetical protein